MLRMLAFSSLLLAGCIPSGTTIDIHDKETFTPNVRLSLGQPGELRAGPAFELGVAQTRGRGTQFIPAGESSSLGSETFYGPREISSETRATIVEAAARMRNFPPEGRVGFELLGGLGYASYDFAVAAGNRRVADGTSALGVVYGVGVIWRVLPSTSVQGRFSVFSSVGVAEESGAERWEIALAQAIGHHLALRGGYSSWDVKSTRTGFSDVRARLSGPALGVELSF